MSILNMLAMPNILSILILFSLCFHGQVQAQTFMCDKANNTLGTCECDMQLFIAENCTKVKNTSILLPLLVHADLQKINSF